MGDYFPAVVLVGVLMMIVSVHLDFLATANRHDQRDPPRPWHPLLRRERPELYTEKGWRYRRRAIAVQIAASTMMVLAWLVMLITELA